MPTCSPPPPCVDGRSPPRRTPSVGARQSSFFQTSSPSSSKNSDAAENTRDVFSRSLIFVWSSAAMQVTQSEGSDLHFPLPTYRPPHPSGQGLPFQVRAPSFLPTTGPTTHLRRGVGYQRKGCTWSCSLGSGGKGDSFLLILCSTASLSRVYSEDNHSFLRDCQVEVPPVFAQSHALPFGCSSFTLDVKNGTAVKEGCMAEMKEEEKSAEKLGKGCEQTQS